MTSEKSKITFSNKDLVRFILLICSKTSENKKIFSSVTKLQKLVFLAQQEYTDEFKQLINQNLYIDNPFNFSADNYGPFSVDLLKLVNRLKKDEEIQEIREGTYLKKYLILSKLNNELREKKELLKNEVFIQWMKKIFKMSQLNLDDLLRYIYTKKDYNHLLINSKIKNKYLS